MRMACRLMVAVTFFTLVAGCSDGRLKLGKVEGTVSVGGKPLEAGKIIFQSDGARAAFGSIENGKIIDVTTYETGDGVPVGLQRYAIQPTTDEAIMMRDPAKAAKMMKEAGIPMKYQQAKTSGLRVEIKKRGVNTITVDIEGR